MTKIIKHYRDKNFPYRCKMTLEIQGDLSADLFCWTNRYIRWANTPKYIIDCDKVEVFEWEEVEE